MIISNVEKTIYEIRPLWNNNSLKTCSYLKKKHPEFPWNSGYRFRSVVKPTPHLGLCFGEAQGSTTSKFGFYSIKDEIPKDCRSIEKFNDIQLVTC